MALELACFGQAVNGIRHCRLGHVGVGTWQAGEGDWWGQGVPVITPFLEQRLPFLSKHSHPPLSYPVK